MEIIYKNFDGLDITFQGAVPALLLDKLSKARSQAEAERREVLVEIGQDKKKVMVAETGARGGYRYRFDTGHDGEIWFIADNDNPENWNIRVSVKSLNLALHGYHAVKEKIYYMLEQMGAYGIDQMDDETGEVTNPPKAYISRVDYCFDLITDNFDININHIIAHGRTKKRPVGGIDYTVVGRTICTVLVGKMPFRQICIYDKTREIKERKKKFWFKIWDKNEKNIEKLNQKIIRTEIRAGKKELKSWNLRTFEDLENKITDVFLDILKNIKYVIPNNDKNPTRWPVSPFWIKIQKELKKELFDFFSNVEKGEIISDLRKNRQEALKKQIIGMIPSYAVTKGITDIDQLPRVLRDIENGLEDARKNERSKLSKQISRAKDKNHFLDENEN